MVQNSSMKSCLTDLQSHSIMLMSLRLIAEMKRSGWLSLRSARTRKMRTVIRLLLRGNDCFCISGRSTHLLTDILHERELLVVGRVVLDQQDQMVLLRL